MSLNAEGIIVTCIDFRLQKDINEWIVKTFEEDKYNRVALAGGIKDLDQILGQIELVVKLHKIKGVILVNHEDCGAYGKEGTPLKHAMDLQAAKHKIKQLYPDLKVQCYYQRLDGTFESIS